MATDEPRQTHADPSSGLHSWAIGDVAEIILRQKRLLLIPVLVSLALGAGFLSRSKPYYEAEARILVQRQNMLMEQGRAPGREDEFLATQVEILASPAILARVVQRLQANSGLESSPAEDSSSEQVQSILNALKVTRVLETNVLNISFRAGDPESAVRTVEQVIASYEEYLREIEEDSQLNVLHLLTRSEKDLRAELNVLNERYQQLRSESPIMGGQGQDVLNVHWTSIEYYSQKLAELENRRTELEYQIEAWALAGDADAVGALVSHDAPHEVSTVTSARNAQDEEASLVAAVWQQPELVNQPGAGVSQEEFANPSSLTEALFRARAHIQQLRVHFGERHRDVELAREEIEFWEQLLQTRFEAAQAQLPVQLDIVRLHEQQLRKLYDQKVKEAKSLDGYLLKERQAWDGIQRAQEIHQTILTQIRELQLNNAALNDGRGRVSVNVLEAPVDAKRQVWPPPLLLLAVCTVVGLVAGLGLIGGLEYADAKIWSQEQVAGSVSRLICGGIPTIATTGRADSLQRSRIAHHAPRSAAGEAFRSLRTHLDWRTGGGQGLVIQVTSPVKAEGKSTVTSNLAFSFAQLGKKVVVVDADLRAGVLHQAFDVSSLHGLTAVLRGGASLDDAIERSPLANIDVLARGREVSDPGELLAHPELDSVLGSLRGRYEVVLVDTSPLLLVSDPLMIAPKVDGVLLSVSIGRSSLRQLRRACELLDTLGSTTLGIVVNQLRINERRYVSKTLSSDTDTPAAPSRPTEDTDRPQYV